MCTRRVHLNTRAVIAILWRIKLLQVCVNTDVSRGGRIASSSTMWTRLSVESSVSVLLKHQVLGYMAWFTYRYNHMRSSKSSLSVPTLSIGYKSNSRLVRSCRSVSPHSNDLEATTSVVLPFIWLLCKTAMNILNSGHPSGDVTVSGCLLDMGAFRFGCPDKNEEGIVGGNPHALGIEKSKHGHTWW